MTTSTEAALLQLDKVRDERELHQRMKWFVDKWSERLDASREETSELSADILLLVHAVHRDASRETHALLRNTLAVMPPVQFVNGGIRLPDGHATTSG